MVTDRVCQASTRIHMVTTVTCSRQDGHRGKHIDFLTGHRWDNETENNDE